MAKAVKSSIENKYVKWFSELSNKDVAIAGGKGASLAEMYNNKFPIPPGFIITADAYRYFLESSKLDKSIFPVLARLNVENTAELEKTTAKVRELIENAKLPGDLEADVMEAYEILGSDNVHNTAKDILRKSETLPFVAVRSSATTEDLADASFAGQQESFLNTKGFEELMLNIKRCFASLFTARAVYYRAKKNFPNEKSYLTVVVQEMINSEKSGVIFSKNPLADDNRVVIEAVWGLGEGIVSGSIMPDHYEVNEKLDLVDYKIAEKNKAFIRNHKGKTEIIPLDEAKANAQVLSGSEIKRLAQYAIQLEEHYGKPQDIEFAIAKDTIYIVQSRPITTKAKKEDFELKGDVLFSGLPASPGIGSGPVKIVRSLSDLEKIQKGDILVTEMTNPDMVVSMAKASAIITDEGGITSHASIVSREMGIPAIVGTKVATKKLKEGQLVTVDGFTGRVIEGKQEAKKIEVRPIQATRTEIKVIVDLPDYASRAAESGAKSVGLVRLESIIATSGKHPAFYLKKNKLKNYVSTLYQGLKKISEPFNSVWIRTSDIRSDEFNNLEGAPNKQESNPMLGDHGIRFSLRNQDLLEAEFTAIKDLADEFPQKRFGIMFPQVISVQEVTEAIKIAKSINLPKNIEFGAMIETPAAVQIIEDLCKHISFISFGTNDLTQYTLALDRNNEDVQSLYNEMHPAVLKSISKVIETCKLHKVKTSICGQAASRPEMAEFLVNHGIDSLSVNADAAHEISRVIADIESNHPVIEEVPENIGGPETESRQENHENHKHHVPMQVKPVQKPKDVDEESIILEALGDDYSPSIPQGKEIPSLNDSIPIGPEDFLPKKENRDVHLEK